MKFIDMFAGIGGFRSGLEQAGHKCIGYIEWDKFARQSYQAMYDTKGEFTANDIQQVKGNSLPEADAWTFGSPCTNISVAGNRKGLKGDQSRMFFEVIRLLKERIRGEKPLPKILIMENVKNLLSSNEGRDFAEVLTQMDSVGYDAEWSVFNSSDVVPQNRERVYIIGHLRGAGTGQVFPIQRQGSDSSQSNEIRIVGNLSKTGYKSHDVLDEKGIATTLTATAYKHPTLVRVSPTKGRSKKYKHTPKVAVHQIGNIAQTKSFGGNPQTGRVYDTDGLSPTLNTMQGGNRQPQIIVRPCLTPDRAKKRQNGRRFKENGEPAFTVTVADRNGVMLKNGDVVAIRKLTPRECWRLQGFSDEQFDKAKNAGVSNSQLYKQAGNAVTVPVVRAIGEKLAENEVKMMRESKLTKELVILRNGEEVPAHQS